VTHLTVAEAAGALWLLVATLLIPSAGAETVCLTLDGGESKRTFEVAVGDKLSLTFTHSIFGAQVEEHFRIGTTTFQPSELRYAEPRLVEFYGHESARHEAGWWVVRPKPAILPSLNLNLSNDASMSLFFDQAIIPLKVVIQPGSALRLTVAICENSADD
jgi:hypothetical protein